MITSIKFSSGKNALTISNSDTPTVRAVRQPSFTRSTSPQRNVVYIDRSKYADRKKIEASQRGIEIFKSYDNINPIYQQPVLNHVVGDDHGKRVKAALSTPTIAQGSQVKQGYITNSDSITGKKSAVERQMSDQNGRGTDDREVEVDQTKITTDDDIEGINALNKILSEETTRYRDESDIVISDKEKKGKGEEEKRSQTLPRKSELQRDNAKSKSLPRPKSSETRVTPVNESRISLPASEVDKKTIEKARDQYTKNRPEVSASASTTQPSQNRKSDVLKQNVSAQKNNANIPVSVGNIASNENFKEQTKLKDSNSVSVPISLPPNDIKSYEANRQISSEKSGIFFPPTVSGKLQDENAVVYRKEGKRGKNEKEIPTSPTLSRVGSVISTANATRTIIQAVLVRCLLFCHSLLCVWRTADVYSEDLYWLLGLSNAVLLIETIVTIIRRKGQETRWVCACFLLYLGGTVPSIWFLEIDKLDHYNDVVEASNLSSVAEGLSTIQGVSLPIQLDPDTWISVLEQSLLFILVIGRLLLPRGNISRDHLSQMLFVFIGSGSDVMELFVVFEEPAFREDRSLRFATLIIWSVSLLQFTLVLPQARSPKKSRFGAESSDTDKFFGMEIWSMVISITLMDGPYLALRLYAIIEYRILSYGIIFFTCKNIMMLVLLIYRFFIICVKMKSHRKRVSQKSEHIP